MSVLIFANGQIDQVEWIRPYLNQATAVIAANGGTRHLQRLNHLPDILIGDQDSLSDDLRTWLKAGDTQLINHPADKDETDLELALLYATEQFSENIMIIGALGGRLDQTLANISLLAHPTLTNRQIDLITSRERAWFIHNHTIVNGRKGDIISLLPLGGNVTVRTSQGLQWPLHNEVLKFGPARGVSNVMMTNIASVTIDSGQLLCIHTSLSEDGFSL